MHVPLYNSNQAHYMEGEAMRAVFESWFVHYKVDVIFAGHVHAYERSVDKHCFHLFEYIVPSLRRSQLIHSTSF